MDTSVIHAVMTETQAGKIVELLQNWCIPARFHEARGFCHSVSTSLPLVTSLAFFRGSR